MNTDDIRLAAAGDKAAFGRLYTEYRPRLLRFAAKQVGEDSAEDIVSESFMTALEHLDGLKEPSAFGSWLYSVAYRKCVDLIRQENRLAAEDPRLCEPFVLPEEQAETREMKELVRRSVEELKPEMRAAVVMYYYEERSVAEVAEALGINENAAKQKLYQARKKLKKRLAFAGTGLAAVPLGALAAKLIGGAAALAVAVGIPVGLHFSRGGLGDRRTDSSIVSEENTPEPEPVLTDNSLPAAPFIAIPCCTGAFAGLVICAVKCGAVSKKRVIKTGIIAAAAVIAETAWLTNSRMGHNPVTYITARILCETGLSDHPIQVQSYPERKYVFPGPDLLAADRAPALGMIPMTSDLEATPNRLYGYSPSEREYFYIEGSALLDALTVSHSDPPARYVGAGDVRAFISEKTGSANRISSDPREYLGTEFYDVIRSTYSSIEDISTLEDIVSEGGETGLAAALALDELTFHAATVNPDNWRTPEEFERAWGNFKSRLRDESFRLDLVLHIAAVSAVSLWLILRIILTKAGSRRRK